MRRWLRHHVRSSGYHNQRGELVHLRFAVHELPRISQRVQVEIGAKEQQDAAPP